MSADGPPAALARLVGQHPASVRRVCWRGPEPERTSPDFLEIETKHGLVVVIDPGSGAVSADPPLPPGIPAGAVRVQVDLTDDVPGAFDARPVISGISACGGDHSGWRLHLSTGVLLTLNGDGAVPVVSRRNE